MGCLGKHHAPICANLFLSGHAFTVLPPFIGICYATSLRAQPGVRDGKQLLSSTGPELSILQSITQAVTSDSHQTGSSTHDTVIASPGPPNAGLTRQSTDKRKALVLLVSYTDHAIFRKARREHRANPIPQSQAAGV